MPPVLFTCPNDGLPLSVRPGGLGCPGGHTFDRAREGYVHLLPAGRKRSRPAGDTDEMIRARRAFLDAGHYAPVIAAVAAAVAGAVAGAASGGAGARRPRVFDAGCGEGTYLAAAARAADADGWGIDIAKPAVRLAARRHGSLSFAVASSFRLPVGDGEVDVAVSVFAPRPWAELARIVGPGGHIVVASPGPDHLGGLRARLYDDPRPHGDRPHTTDEGPRAGHRQRVRYDLTVEADHARALLQMTPYWWTATAEQQARVGTEALATTVDVMVTTHDARPAGL